jgi:hypothetical protein
MIGPVFTCFPFRLNFKAHSFPALPKVSYLSDRWRFCTSEHSVSRGYPVAQDIHDVVDAQVAGFDDGWSSFFGQSPDPWPMLTMPGTNCSVPVKVSSKFP